MRVHLHTLCWNDRPMLDFFFRHYQPWVDRFFILDDGSTDGTRQYLEARSDVVLGRTVRTDPASWVRSAQHIYNNAWKQSRGEADWVVVTNIDEHLHHPSMRDYLRRMDDEGITAIPSPGYQMIADAFPPPDAILARDCRMGAPWSEYSRLGIFKPDAIVETNFSVGRHAAKLEGRVAIPVRDETANLHYKYLGPAETQTRQRALGARLGDKDRAQGWGHQYGWSDERLQAHFETFKAALVDIAAVDHDDYPEPRWWRPDYRTRWADFKRWLAPSRRLRELRQILLRD